MKQLDLMIIGGVAVLALFLEAGAAAHAPSASVDQLALYEAVQMHQYMTVTDPTIICSAWFEAGRTPHGSIARQDAYCRQASPWKHQTFGTREKEALSLWIS
jgi:hypothetical protein